MGLRFDGTQIYQLHAELLIISYTELSSSFVSVNSTPGSSWFPLTKGQ